MKGLSTIKLATIKLSLIGTIATFAIWTFLVSVQIEADAAGSWRLHRLIGAVGGGLVLCGLGFIAVLLWQNRLLARTHDRLRALTEGFARGQERGRGGEPDQIAIPCQYEP